MTDYKPQKGDHVRVVLEGEVTSPGEQGEFTLLPNNHCTSITLSLQRLAGFSASIEKIEPPVTVFKPGDLLRRKSDGTHYLITLDGWTIVGNGYVEEQPAYRPFTSEHYELVSLG